MFTLINSVVLAPLALPEPDRLVSIHTAFERRGENWGASTPDFGGAPGERRPGVAREPRRSAGGAAPGVARDHR